MHFYDRTDKVSHVLLLLSNAATPCWTVTDQKSQTQRCSLAAPKSLGCWILLVCGLFQTQSDEYKHTQTHFWQYDTNLWQTLICWIIYWTVVCLYCLRRVHLHSVATLLNTMWHLWNCWSAGIFMHNHLLGSQMVQNRENIQWVAGFWAWMPEVRGQRRMGRLLWVD